MVIVSDRYRLEQERGEGGMATVWLVHDLLLDRPAALKLLLPAEEGTTPRRDRLRGEARALAALDHPCVVRVYDLGQHEGRDYIVMEYFEGGSLSDRLVLQGPLPPHEAALLMLQVLDALHAAHRAGIVHRDVKPGNILVRVDGSIALCDFGIARIADGSETRTGIALGSMGFMAPEQRIDARTVGPQADLYAAACTLYNLITADTPVDLFLAQDHSPRWEPIPASLRPFLRRATRSEPSARFHDALEMTEALRLVLPTLEDLPAAKTRNESPDIGYVPTRESSASEPSLKAEQRQRAADLDAWAWANKKRRPVGQAAIWIGTTACMFATAVGVVLGPMATSELPQGSLSSAPAVSEATPDLLGQWQGTFGGRPGLLVLRGAPQSLVGEVVMTLGAHELKSVVVGAWNPNTRELVLIEANAVHPATYRARMFPNGLILEGTLTRTDGGEALPFALVRQ